MDVTFQTIKSDLISMGFAFDGLASKVPPDPEKTIIKCMTFFYTDMKIFRILLCWLERHSDLINLERMAHLLHDHLTETGRPVLHAISLKLRAFDKRWDTILKRVKNEAFPIDTVIIDTHYNDSFIIQRDGLDEEFASCGFRVGKITSENPKKIMIKEHIFISNPWLYARGLIGPNYRADVYYVIRHQLAKNPFQAAKKLGCQYETAHRLWAPVKAAVSI